MGSPTGSNGPLSSFKVARLLFLWYSLLSFRYSLRSLLLVFLLLTQFSVWFASSFLGASLRMSREGDGGGGKGGGKGVGVGAGAGAGAGAGGEGGGGGGGEDKEKDKQGQTRRSKEEKMEERRGRRRVQGEGGQLLVVFVPVATPLHTK